LRRNVRRFARACRRGKAATNGDDAAGHQIEDADGARGRSRGHRVESRGAAEGEHPQARALARRERAHRRTEQVEPRAFAGGEREGLALVAVHDVDEGARSGELIAREGRDLDARGREHEATAIALVQRLAHALAELLHPLEERRLRERHPLGSAREVELDGEGDEGPQELGVEYRCRR
jgi:hypothetical protein